jgi:hypothetical protein
LISANCEILLHIASQDSRDTSTAKPLVLVHCRECSRKGYPDVTHQVSPNYRFKLIYFRIRIVGQPTAEEFIKDLIENVVLKLT